MKLMMKYTRALSFFFLLIFNLTALANQKTAIITIDGIPHKVSINEDKKIKIGTEEHIINIKLSQYNLFKIEGISFKYMSNMTYTEDTSDPAVSIWDMDGDTTVIFVQKHHAVISNKQLVNGLKQQFENMKATVTTKKSILKCKDFQLIGVRLNIKLGNISLSQEVYSKTSHGKTIALLIQGTLNDQKLDSNEYKKTRQLLIDTLSMK